MSVAKRLGFFFNLVIVCLIVAALFDAVEWATVGITTAVLFALSLIAGLIEGKIQRRIDEVDDYYAEQIYHLLEKQRQEEQNKTQ
ncbi:hypothetical protein [Methylophaga pinxianii]|uniref:hypothetical protein n=1 Tax=Methylophaga pinxianii TaxID=2881052 RepID=UPI001CF4CE8D|nr:hypothetical protein [Methylophaga pinxianii]MCB2425576.1 hypothetical protein [Methylophaga pinxianii]UPH45030.1 hypothetical protein LGT42_010965 [Methylophaga pinxianii]